MTGNSPYLEGQLLMAMPHMSDERFAQSVVYMCVHNADGAMGLVLNKALEGIDFAKLLDQVGFEGEPADNFPIQFGGPVEPGRGFVLHTADVVREETMMVGDGIALTATVDILRAIAEGEGPAHAIVALGYAGWAPGQLDGEIQANGWLHGPADLDIIFGTTADDMWPRAVGRLGIGDPSRLSSAAGHA
ncbi:YqgE/AlgH family protein [Marinibaculum pumilum]|uniref:UPF0301 protein ACFOGJ_04620 n=1 Tax=Marinibaculum pumilum TaxID=1766165 RepID=A0ABV7KWF9_9PROT